MGTYWCILNLWQIKIFKLWQFSEATGVNLNTSVPLKHNNFKIKKDFPRKQNCYKSLANAIIKLTYVEGQYIK